MSNIETVDLNFKKYSEHDKSLIIIHGLFGCYDNWHTLAKRFSKKMTVYALDLRNHGRSPHHHVFTYEAMASDIHQFIKKNNIQSPYLLGHSLGGKVVMHTVKQYPDITEKIIIADIAPKKYPAQHNNVFEALNSVDFNLCLTRDDVDNQLEKWIKEKNIRLFLMKNLTRDNNNQLKWKMNLPIIEKNYPTLNEGLPSEIIFPKEALFVKGELSNYISDDDFEKIFKLFPKATIETLNGAGHWVHAEAPDLFFDCVDLFLSRQP